MRETVTGTLPGGYWDSAGNLHNSYELTALTGRDEELLVARGTRRTANLVTEVLARALRRVGSISPVPEAVTRAMLVGDRQFLLVRLRQATFGDEVSAHLRCPWRDCGKDVTVQFSLTQLPVIETNDKGPTYVMQLSDCDNTGGGEKAVSFRLPTGDDQEQLTELCESNEARALTVLLERCILDCPCPVSALSARGRAEIESRMQQLAPGIDQLLDARCAECAREFLVPFNVQRFLFGEFRADCDLLYREVHYLAYHYHWSEPDIMAMSRGKRRSYIDMLAGEIDRLNDEV